MFQLENDKPIVNIGIYFQGEQILNFNVLPSLLVLMMGWIRLIGRQFPATEPLVELREALNDTFSLYFLTSYGLEWNRSKLNDCLSLSKQIPEIDQKFPLRINVIRMDYSFYSARLHFLKLSDYLKNPKKLSSYAKILQNFTLEDSSSPEIHKGNPLKTFSSSEDDSEQVNTSSFVETE